MDDQTAKYLWALREINKALVTGLETAVFVMEKGDQLTPEMREPMIEKLQGLIAQSNKVYGEEPPKQ